MCVIMGDEFLFFSVAIWWGFAMAPGIWWKWRETAAPYGRHHAHADAGASSLPLSLVMLPTRISWFLMECPPLLLTPPLFSLGRFACFPVPRVLALLFLIHYIHRALVYPLRMSLSRTRNLPLLILLSGFIFNMYNTYIQVRSLSHFTSYPSTWLSSPCFLVGAVLFMFGMIINILADSTLMSLRKSTPSKPMTDASKSYQIPKGGLYELISCPNYFGEILEWLGWAVATWSLAGLVFFVLTVCNLLPRAVAHHRWYIKSFPNYPRSRKILVPFIF